MTIGLGWVTDIRTVALSPDSPYPQKQQQAQHSAIRPCQEANSLFPFSLPKPIVKNNNNNNIEGMFPLLPASFPTVGGFSHHHLQLGVYPFKSFSTHIQTSTYKYAHHCWKLFFGFCFFFFTKMNSYYIYWSATCFFFSFKTIAQ